MCGLCPYCAEQSNKSMYLKKPQGVAMRFCSLVRLISQADASPNGAALFAHQPSLGAAVLLRPPHATFYQP